MADDVLTTIKSLKSMRSIRSLKSQSDVDTSNEGGEDFAMAFEEILPKTCFRYNCEFPVIVKKEVQRDNLKTLKHQERTKYKKISLVTSMTSKQDDFPEVPSGGKMMTGEEFAVVVTALYDTMNRLAEIVLYKVSPVPRALMQIIGLLAPHYDQLFKISIRRCGIDIYTIHELQKMLPLTVLSDICLDGSPLLQGNYAILLDEPSQLRNLSLCRCRVNDKVCQQIASKLHYNCPAEKQLLVLNLSSNQITHVGAKYLAEALRSNRHLRYLNLADNQIYDDGALEILNTLGQFLLTSDELLKRRWRYVQYLRARNILYLKYLNGAEVESVYENEQVIKKKNGATKKKSSKSKSAKEKSAPPSSPMDEENLQQRAEAMAAGIMGPFVDPFEKSLTKVKDGLSYCSGNTVLTYLNLSYNNLTHLSVKKILDVVRHQNITMAPHQTGLLKIVIEGNPFPEICQELNSITDLLTKNIGRFASRCYGDGRRKSRTTLTRILTVPDVPKSRKK